VKSRPTAEWKDDYDGWQKRDLSAGRYVYMWVDGVFLKARMKHHGGCMLALIGATPEGKKELIVNCVRRTYNPAPRSSG